MKAILLLLCAAGVASAGSIFTVTDLGSLGGPAAQAFGLNASGVAVGSATSSFGYTHAFSSFGFGITDLSINTGATEGIASAINSSGEIVGTQFVNGQAYATIWKNGAAQTVGGSGSFATAINDSGQVAGMLGDGHAFDGASELNAFAWSSAYGINSFGTVAGYAQTSPGVFAGFVWTPSTGYVLLGTFGGRNSYAMAINDSGEVVGTAQLASGYTNAFLWNNGAMEDLGTLGGSSYAYGINAAGNVVGYSYVNGLAHAFLFENGTLFDLNSLIDRGSGWVLNEAYSINASGQIVGSGLLKGIEHAFRLDYTPGNTNVPVAAPDSIAAPEPATWMLAILGLVLIVSSRIRFRPRLRRPPQPRTREPRR
jgi:probable HAF family extracellular repeat protein